MLRTDLKIAVLLLAMSGLAGCASTTEMDSMREEVRQANQAAQEAAASAEAARKEAAEARAIAEAAKASAEESNSKIDRMFKKSMYK